MVIPGRGNRYLFFDTFILFLQLFFLSSNCSLIFCCLGSSYILDYSPFLTNAVSYKKNAVISMLGSVFFMCQGIKIIFMLVSQANIFDRIHVWFLDQQTIISTAPYVKLYSLCFSFAGKDTLRCLALALKRMPTGQQSISLDDEKDLTFIGLVCFLSRTIHLLFSQTFILAYLGSRFLTATNFQSQGLKLLYRYLRHNLDFRSGCEKLICFFDMQDFIPVPLLFDYEI